MSVQVPITGKELRELESVLGEEREVVCLDDAAYLKALLVGREMLIRGDDVKAKIVRAAKP
jgi:hypothetical protein